MHNLYFTSTARLLYIGLSSPLKGNDKTYAHHRLRQANAR
jgi:hypothetical protein